MEMTIDPTAKPGDVDMELNIFCAANGYSFVWIAQMVPVLITAWETNNQAVVDQLAKDTLTPGLGKVPESRVKL